MPKNQYLVRIALPGTMSESTSVVSDDLWQDSEELGSVLCDALLRSGAARPEQVLAAAIERISITEPLPAFCGEATRALYEAAVLLLAAWRRHDREVRRATAADWEGASHG